MKQVIKIFLQRSLNLNCCKQKICDNDTAANDRWTTRKSIKCPSYLEDHIQLATIN